MGARAGRCTIAVDAMGGDLGPTEFIRGLSYATEELKLDCDIVLVGSSRLLERLLKVRNLKVRPSAIRIHHASEVIGMDEKPVHALKTKKDSSMLRAIELVSEGKADAVVSCGNTGALMASGTLRLRTLEGVARTALGLIIPGRQQPSVLVDAGANPESNSDHLVHNAILGSNYSRAALNIENPRVALLNVGAEEGKGNRRINEAHEKLKKVNGVINYVGPIEGFDVFSSSVDVTVCDGFVGNILIKSCESLFGLVGSAMKEELKRNPKRIIGAALSKSAFRDMRYRLSPDRFAGAPLLGLKGNILKSHGSSNYQAIANAMRIATEIVRHDMIDSIRSEIKQANEIIQPGEAVAHSF